MGRKKALLLAGLALIMVYGLLLLRFSLRNDQMNYFLPVRMFMSDAFNHGEFMLWNPFMSGSYPIHCDMQGSVWNPITLVFSWLFNYNASLLSAELLLYLLIGVAGCFYFAGNFTPNPWHAAAIAVCYGCCGFAVSSLEFMDWEASLAFIPWTIHFFWRILTKKGFGASAGFSISLWLMLVCGYPSFLIYLGYILLSAFAAYGYRRYRQKRQKEIAKTALYLLLGFGMFCLLSLPAIHSFFEYLPYYARGKAAGEAQLNGESFSWNYLLSLIFPGAGLSNYEDDLYFGLLPVLVLGLSAKKIGMGFRNRFLLLGIGFSFFFTLGSSTPVRIWCARYLPLLGSFGFSHSIRIFMILGLFVLLIPQLDVFCQGADPVRTRRIRFASGLAGAVLLIFLLADRQRVMTKSRPFCLLYYASAAWQLVLMAALCFPRKIFSSSGRLFFFIVADLLGSVLLTAPWKGLSRTPPAVRNADAARFYATDQNAGLLFPAGGNGRTEMDKRREPNAVKTIPRRNFSSNTRLDTFYRYIRDENHYRWLLSRPFAFAAGGEPLSIHRIRLGYNTLAIDVTARDSCRMLIQQTPYWRWKSETPGHPVSAYEGVLLQVGLHKGLNRIRLSYAKTDLLLESLISALMLGSLGLWGLVRWRKKARPPTG